MFRLTHYPAKRMAVFGAKSKKLSRIVVFSGSSAVITAKSFVGFPDGYAMELSIVEFAVELVPCEDSYILHAGYRFTEVAHIDI